MLHWVAQEQDHKSCRIIILMMIAIHLLLKKAKSQSHSNRKRKEINIRKLNKYTLLY